MCALCLRTETGISGLAPLPDSSAYTLGFSPPTRHSPRGEKAEANPIRFLSRRMEAGWLLPSLPAVREGRSQPDSVFEQKNGGAIWEGTVENGIARFQNEGWS